MTSDTFLPEMGGAEIHVVNIIKNLKNLGCEIELLTNEANKSEQDSGYLITRLAWSKKNIFKIWQILWRKSKDIDLIHAHYSYRLAFLAVWVAKLRRKPCFVILHGTGTLPRPHSKWCYQLADYIYRYFSLNLATKVISTSQDLADVAAKYMPVKNIVVIPNGFDEEMFNDGVVVSNDLVEKYQGKKIILTVRRLVEKNGVHFLVESLPKVIKQEPNIFYLMIGDGRMREYLKGRIEALGIDDHVEMLGTLDNSLVPQYLKLAQVVVFPSTAESSSLACAEAMAVGQAAVVASRVGGLVELLGKDEERGTLVKLVDWQQSNYNAPIQLPPDRYQALAQAIINTLQQKPTVKMNNAFEFAHHNLSWKIIAQKTFVLFQQYKK